MLSGPIVAVATGPGSSALGIVRITGLDDSFLIIDGLIGARFPLQKWSSRRLYRVSVFDSDGALLDDATALLYRAPKSYTGENSLELIVHGGPQILSSILASCHARGVRAAEAGEFTRRALLNGKLSLPQAQAVNLLTQASTKAAQKHALLRLRIGTPFWESLREKLINLLAYIEVHIDYPDEAMDHVEALRTKWIDLEKDLKTLIRQSQRAQKAFSGWRVVLIGRPNVGKSSLLNALVGYERAIVSSTAGTTRDHIEVYGEIAERTVVYIDTAGMHESDDPIEKQGLQHTHEQLKQADILLAMVDSAQPHQRYFEQKQALLSALPSHCPHIFLFSRADSASPGLHDADAIHVSSRTEDGLDDLEKALEETLQKIEEMDNDGKNIALDHGEIARFVAAHESLMKGLELIAEGERGGILAFDILALLLQEAIHELSILLGTISIDEMLDNIFKNFCVGK